MTDYKLLFLDIDGTILRPDDTIEDSTKEAIKAVQKKGIEVFLATGRPLHEILDIGEELGINSFIGYNGAYALHKGKIVYDQPMNSDFIQSYLNIALDHGHDMIFYTNSKNLITSNSKPINDFMKKLGMKSSEPFSRDYIDQILGLTIINLDPNGVPLYQQEGIHLSPVQVEGFTNSLDVIRETVNKGVAIETIANKLGFSMDQTIAFGDGMNDKEMLSKVGEGFAMGNATPDLIPYAKHQTTLVTDSGVYNGLKSLGLVE